jgi:hypothetical protein
VSTSDLDIIRIEARLEEAREVEKRSTARVRELIEALAAAKMTESVAKEVDQGVKLEAELEALPWKEAQSKKCYYAKDIPAELVESVRNVKGGVVGKVHHFTAANDSPTLFRFNRGPKK